MSHTNPSAELEPPSTDLITLTRHILSQQAALGERASGDLTLLLIGIQVSWASEAYLLPPPYAIPYAGHLKGPKSLSHWLPHGERCYLLAGRARA